MVEYPRFELSKLPPLPAPLGLWPSIAARLDRRRARNRRWLSFAAAASLGLAALCVHWLVTGPGEPGPGSGGASLLSETIRASAALETRLGTRRHAVIGLDQLERLAWLENELGWIDELLIDRPADARLWQRRVAVLDELDQGYAANEWQILL